MNQPSSFKSLDHLDTSSNSTDSELECETISVPDLNNPGTVKRFIDRTINSNPNRKPNIDQVSIVNSEDVHIGDRHYFHFHGVNPPIMTVYEKLNENEDAETKTDNVENAPFPVTPMRTKSVFRDKKVILPLACVVVIGVVLVVVILVASIKNWTAQPEFISRELWQAVDPSETLPDNDPALLVVLKHTGGATCKDFQSCSARVREIQNEDMKQYPDIRYNFLTGGDGRIYEGRGWLVRNEGIRSDSVDIAFIGNFSTEVPSAKMLLETRNFIFKGISKKKINYRLYYVVAHNQTEPTDSPGENVFKNISKNFDHYSNAVCYDMVHGVVQITELCPPQ